MFGASEDRARQLAYRKRRDKMILGNTCSTYRSLSFASGMSQQSHVFSTSDHDVEHRRQQFLDAADTVDYLVPIGSQISQVEQHTIQAEDLSQVLYSSFPFSATSEVSYIQSVSTLCHGNYESHEYPVVSRHVRNITMPIAYAEIQAVLSSAPQLCRIPSTLDDHYRAQTMVSLRGGGDDTPRKQGRPRETQTPAPPQNKSPLQNQRPNQRNFQAIIYQPPPLSPPSSRTPATPLHDSTRQYMQICPFAIQYYWRAEWNTPISAGGYLTDIRLRLSASDAATFFSLFNHYQPPTHSTAPAAIERQNFYQNLDSTAQAIFQQIIVERHCELRNVERGTPDPQVAASYLRSSESVMVYHLLEALENPVIPSSYQFSRDSRTFQTAQLPMPQRYGYDQHLGMSLALSYNAGMLTSGLFAVNSQLSNVQTVTRRPPHAQNMAIHFPNVRVGLSMQPSRSSTLRGFSAPDLGKQQRQSGYYSGGSGAAGSTAAKTTLNKLFDNYRENAAGEPDSVGIEGTMKYLVDIDVDLEGLESFAVSEIVQAPTMGEMTREGFVNGWLERNCETIDKQKTYIKNLKRELPGNRELFDRIYKYSFTIARAANSKQAPLEQAIAFWELLFSSPLSAIQWKSASTPWLDWWKEFLETSFKKSINKDMWNETLKFAKLTLEDENMTFWTEESSWPSVIDEFVEWVKNEKRGGAKEEAMDEEY